jgi:crotonobetainyl-CoA:carnitine CoA-transferase CaiB-like acyl-CoA transferase
MSSATDGTTCGQAAAPLKGFKVLGLEQYISGPYATMVLSDLGAEIIKIERPVTGDPRRAYPPRVEGNGTSLSAPFLFYNRNKKSVTIELHISAGRDLFLDLVRNADAVVENFKPGTADRLGIGYEACKGANPKIVYAAISGFGRLAGFQGPLSNDACFDPVAQAMGGIMDLTGSEDGPPLFPMVGLADLYSGMLASLGVTAALLAREKTGQGQFVDIAMYDAIVSLIERPIALYALTGEIMQRGPDRVVPIAAFRVANGYIALTAPSEEMWRRLCRAIDRADLIEDPRFKSQAERPKSFHTHFKPIFESWAADKDSQQVCARLRAEGIPAGPVQTVVDLFKCPQLDARQMLVEMDLPSLQRKVSVARTPILFSSGTPAHPTEPPSLGRDTAEVLRSTLGIQQEQFDELRAAGVI